MPKFEIALHNEEVRIAVKSGDKHVCFEDAWADTHYIKVTATSEDMVLAKIGKQYPKHRGFVVEQVSGIIPDQGF